MELTLSPLVVDRRAVIPPAAREAHHVAVLADVDLVGGQQVHRARYAFELEHLDGDGPAVVGIALEAGDALHTVAGDSGHLLARDVQDFARAHDSDAPRASKISSSSCS